MSKAFASEDNDGGEIPDSPALPPGTRNYMTSQGAAKLRALVGQLTKDRRPISSGIENQARLQKIERQLRYWLPRLEALEVIDPLTQPKDQILFGATVALRDDKGGNETWRIVGMDESDLPKRWISWMSPLASALLNKKVGEMIVFMNRRLTVEHIVYDA